MVQEDILSNKKIIGQVEDVQIKIKNKKHTYKSRIDTGASSSSIDSKLVASLKIGPMTSVKKIRNAHGETLRPVVNILIELKGKEISTHFTVANRSKMKYKILIGRNILKEGFLVDVTK